ncbi:MAG: ArsR/SmtB family transcription factor [Phycisphaerales bacterium]
MTQSLRKPPTSPRQAGSRRKPVDALLDADFFKSVSDPTRVRLLACLIKCARPCSVSEIAGCCDVDLSVVSRHLKALADAGILASEKRGRAVMYEVRSAELCATLRALAAAIEQCDPRGGAGCCGGGCNG